MPPGIGYGKKLGLPNEQDMFGDALMQQFGEGAKIDGTGRTMPGGGVVGPQPGANQTQPFGAPQKIADPSMPKASMPNVPVGNGGNGGAGGAGQQHFNGFDFGQDASNRDPGSSAKYAFSDFAGNHAGTDTRWQMKETADDFFNDHIRGGMEAAGYKIHDVVGDKVFISTRESDAAGLPGVWVDWVENADDPSRARLAWQDETMGGGGAGAAGGGAQAASRPGGGSLNSMFGQVGNDATMAAILAEIEKYIDPQQMQALLGGALFEQMQGGQEPLL